MPEFETKAYLDNAATTPMLPEVVDAVVQAMAAGYGNASALHARGKAAREKLEESRAVVAGALGVKPEEVRFTSGGTESNNLAIFGAAKAAFAADPERRHVVASAIEHASVTKTVRGLKREGWDVSYVKAPRGQLDLMGLYSKVDPKRTSLVSVMRVQNETGFLLPVDQVAAIAHERAPQALVHSDGVQAFGKVDFRPAELGLDLASVCAHKIGGPQGIGALYVREGVNLFTTAFGGGQEKGLRSGTEAVPLAIGFAKAAQLVMARRAQAAMQVSMLRELLLAGVVATCPDVVLNSAPDGSPYVVSFSVPGCKGNAIDLGYFDDRGVYVSRASACKALHPEVPDEDMNRKHPRSLQMAGVHSDLMNSTLRVSFSQATTTAEVNEFLKVFGQYISEFKESK